MNRSTPDNRGALDYEACMERAAEKAKEEVTLMFPPGDPRREEAERRLKIRYFYELTQP